jgi:hypothetical protein
MEIIKWVFYIFLGIVIVALALYFVASPFALVIGLFNPRAVLDEKKPQTRLRVLKYYGVTSIIMTLISFGAFSSTAAENSVYTPPNYSSPLAETTSTATISTYTPVVERMSSPSPTDIGKWANVRSDRAIQVTEVNTVSQISPNNEFATPVDSKGGQLVVVTMKLKNIGQESGDMMWTDFKLIDTQGRKYDDVDDFSEILSIDMWLGDQGLDKAGSQMFPGETIETAKVFRVAPDASNFKLAVNGKIIDIS